MLQNFNKCIIDGKFPNQLKKAGVSLVFKKGNNNNNNNNSNNNNNNNNNKTNYRPVSILPSLSKIYERLIYKQINQ